MQIAADPGRIYNMMTDIEQTPRRFREISKVKLMTNGPFARGTKWMETRKLPNKETSQVLSVTETRQGEGYSVSSESNSVSYLSRFDLEPMINGAMLTLTVEAKPSNPLAGLMMMFSKGAMLKAITKDLNSVKQAAETE